MNERKIRANELTDEYYDKEITFKFREGFTSGEITGPLAYVQVGDRRVEIELDDFDYPFWMAAHTEVTVND